MQIARYPADSMARNASQILVAILLAAIIV